MAWAATSCKTLILSRFDRASVALTAKRLQNEHLFGAFLFSFGTSHGYVVISATGGRAPAGWVAGLEKFAVILAVANLMNCSLGAFGALHVVCKDPEEEEEATMVVVQATEVVQ